MRHNILNTGDPLSREREVPFDNSFQCAVPLYESGRRLHLKAQRIISLWEALFERGAPLLPSNRKIIGEPAVFFKFIVMIGLFAVLAATYVAFAYEWMLTQKITLRLSVWLGVGIFSVLCFQERQYPLTKLFWPLWLGGIAAVCEMPIPGYLCLAVGISAWVRNYEVEPGPKSRLLSGVDFLVSYGALAAGFIRPPLSLWELVTATLFFVLLQGVLEFLHMMAERVKQ